MSLLRLLRYTLISTVCYISRQDGGQFDREGEYHTTTPVPTAVAKKKSEKTFRNAEKYTKNDLTMSIWKIPYCQLNLLILYFIRKNQIK